MAYRYANREQEKLFPKRVEDYVQEDDPVRAYDAFVEELDLKELGIEINSKRVGNSEYYPTVMLKLLLYGYSYGVRSSRKLERACHHNISFIWLLGGLKPDFKTIANFRKNNKDVLKKVLKQCARICLRLGLIEGNILFVDGSKIRGNASIKNTWTKEKCERALEHIDANIETLLTECDSIDKEEQDLGSYARLKEELQDKNKLKEKIKEIEKELALEEKKSINTIDPECTRINSLQGSHAGYNVQIVADEKNGLIVSSDAVSENNDLNQFANQINQANEILEKKCTVACADSGYSTTSELEKIDSQEIKVVVPSQRQASDKEVKDFDKENFKYDEENDCYICPEGEKLINKKINKEENNKVYRITNAAICKSCKHFGVCTKSKDGRTIHRLLNEEARLRFERQYKEEESQKIYKLRMQKVELIFGHIKRNLGVSAFLLRGLDGVKAEASLLASCFNIVRMINILGVKQLIPKLIS